MKIDSFEQACELRGYDQLNCLPDVANLPERFRNMPVALTKALIICEAANVNEKGEVWEPDWNNDDEEKWTCLYDLEVDKNNPTGFRFYGSHYGLAAALAGAGSGLCFKTDEDATFHFTKHAEIFRELMTFPKK